MKRNFGNILCVGEIFALKLPSISEKTEKSRGSYFRASSCMSCFCFGQESSGDGRKVAVFGTALSWLEHALGELRDIQQVVSSESTLVVLTASGLIYQIGLTSQPQVHAVEVIVAYDGDDD